MATPVSWLVTDNAGNPVDDAFPLPTVVAYAALTGARSAPAVVRRQPGGNKGLFGIDPTDADAAAGTAYLIDNGAAGNPQRMSGAIYAPGFPIIVVALEDNAGALWTGVGPTFGGYVLKDGSTPTPPAWVPVAGNYLWVAVPPAADVEGFVSYTIIPPAGSSATPFGGSPFQARGITTTVADTVLEVVRAELLADPTVASLVASRIYPLVVPQAANWPAMVLQVVSSSPENSFEGTADTRLEESRLQVDCYATTYRAAHQLARAVDLVVANLRRSELSAERDSLQDDWDDEVQVHRVSMDFLVWR